MNLAVILQIALFILLIAEIVIPSGGVLFIVSAGILVWSWVEIVGMESSGYLVGFAALDIIGIPLLLWYSIKVLEKSKFALQSELSQADGYQVQADWSTDGTEPLTGKQGIVTQDLRPIGKIEIEGQEYEALSQNDWIESGKTIQVLSAEENKIIVTLIHQDSLKQTTQSKNQSGEPK